MNASFEQEHHRLEEKDNDVSSCLIEHDWRAGRLFKQALICLIDICLSENGGLPNVAICNRISKMIKTLSEQCGYVLNLHVIIGLRNHYKERLIFEFPKSCGELLISSLPAGIVVEEVIKYFKTMRDENIWPWYFNQDDSQKVAASVLTRLQEQNAGEPTQNDLDMANNYLKGCAIEVIFAPDCTDLIFRLTSINARLERFLEKYFLC